MKSVLRMLALALLGAGESIAQSTDAETEKRWQEMEARRRAEMERERHPEIQHPILRYPPVPADKNSPPAASSTDLLRQAVELETRGKGPEAVKLYVRAARGGNGKAALRLQQIYEKGIPGVTRDYAESLKWEQLARVLGEDVPPRKKP